MAHSSPLLTATQGDPNSPAVLVLHDRYENLDAIAVADSLPGGRVVRVRSARTQMSGTEVLGHFWFLGPYEKPELTTFGDGLHHLETLLTGLSYGAGKARSFLVGKGEGGVMALTLATVWPELLAGVVSIDGPLPETIDSFPIQPRPPLTLPVLLIEHERPMARTAAAMSGLGAQVELKKVDDQPMQAAVAWLNRSIAAISTPASSGAPA